MFAYLDKNTISTFKIIFLVFLIPFLGIGQVNITTGNPSVTINFSNTMQTSVGTNPSTAFAGNGFSPNPTIAGRLNSNAWEVSGFSFGSLAIGGTQTVDSFGRGSVATGVVTHGVYAFTELPATVANPTLMIQPGVGEFEPGSITLRVKNNGTANMTQLQVDYNLFVRNDGNKSSSFNFSHSLDNIAFQDESSLDYISPELSDLFEWVQEGVSPSRSFIISGINVPPGGFYYVRWSSEYVSGSGTSDEFGLDDIVITGTYGTPSPEINVTGAGLTILNNDTSPRIADGTEFASISTPLSTFNNTLTKTFEIQNLGGAPLNVSSVVIGGINPSDFTIFVPGGNQPSTGTINQVSGGVISYRELNIVFDPSAAGLRRAIVYIYNDDSNENPYVFHIRGYGFDPVPEITLTGNTGGTGSITSGSLVPSLGNNTLFANQIVGVTNQTKDYKIKNDGSFVLNLTAASPYITIGGANPSDFTLVTFPNAANVNPGFTKTFSINFNPTAVGIRTAIVTIPNTDSNENPYTFLIQGVGISSEIDVFGNGQPIVSGSTIPTFVNDTFFDYINVSNFIDKVFTIQNNGTSVLNIGAITLTGVSASEYTVISLPSNTLAVGASTTFTIRFNPLSVGVKNATVSIVNNDLNENPYLFAITGFCVNYVSCDFGAIETIAIQDFEASPATPTWSYSTTGTVSVTGGTANAVGSDGGLTDKFIDARSLQVSNTTATITMAPIDTSSFSDVQLNVRIGAFSTNVTNGMDLTIDRVTAQVSNNGGLSWSSEVQVMGNVNSVWSFNSGIATASKVYSGTNVVQIFNPSSVPSSTINYQTTGGYSNLVISNLPKIPNLLIRLQVVTNSSQEVWAIDNITLFGRKEITSTWNGTAWDNGTPTSSIKAVLNGNYNTSTNGSLSACKCEINTGRTLSVQPNTFAEIQSNIINNGSVIIENSGSLVQRNDFATNSGNIVVKRNTTPMIEYDYTYWSSPVGSQTLYNLSPLTSADRFYFFNQLIGNWTSINRNSIMTPGVGYIARSPDSFGNTATVYNAQFSGTINNGFIQTPIVNGVSEWNLIGNPYPSALNADDLLSLPANSSVVGGTIYFWTHNTPISSTYQYVTNDYAIYNLLGGVGTAAALNSGVNVSIPNGKIASGQGFFIKGLSSNNLTFINSMRTTSQNNAFFRNTAAENTNGTLEKHRIWLSLRNNQGAFKQLLVGYVQNGTNSIDRDFDGTTLNSGNVINFYSLCETQLLAIQGRQLPFTTNDEVPLGYKSNIAGNFSIHLDDFDGLFTTNQEIYLEDRLLNVIHDLKESPYNFTTVIGENNNRFLLRYTAQALGNTEFDSVNQVVISTNDSQINITSKTDSISQVQVFDLLGREIYAMSNLDTLVYSFAYNIKNQALIVKVKLVNGAVISKKIIVN